MRKAILLLTNLMLRVVYAADVTYTLEVNQNLYSNTLSKIEAERTKGLAAALQGYAGELEGVRRVFIAKPDLDGVKAVDMAKEDSCRGNVVTNSSFKELVEVASKYQDRAEIVAKTKEKAHLDLLEFYLNSLERTQRALLVTNDLVRAEAVDIEIKKVKDLKSELELDLKVVKFVKAANTVKEDGITVSQWKDITGDFKGGAKTAEGIVICAEKTQSRLSYRPPIEIKYVCKTASTNIRVAYACPQIIFNWETDMDVLRMAGVPFPGKGRVPANQFVTIRQVVLNDRMEIYVNDVRRAEIAGDFSKVRDPIAVFSPADVKPPPTLTVKSVSVRNPKGMLIKN